MNSNKGILFMVVLATVLLSGCDDKSADSLTAQLRNTDIEYQFGENETAWLRNHLPMETVAYMNFPTPWNYLFDAKADALHAVQSLPAHKKQVSAIKQGVKDNYYPYIPAEVQGITSLLLEHVSTSFEVAVINESSTALLPTVAVGTRLEGITADELDVQLSSLMAMVDPSIEWLRQEQNPQWTFKVNMFPAFVRFEESTGRFLMFGGMGATMEKMTALWEQAQSTQSSAIKQLSQSSDPSGLNFKLWLAPARLYQLGGAFVPPEQHAMISQLGLDQMDYVWLGAESSQGQSALALHVLMPETGWRLMLPRSTDWFDVEVAGLPRSVIQLAMPTADQIEQAISHFKLDQMINATDRKELQQLFEFEKSIGINWQNLFEAYHQQIYMVTDDSGSWSAMKIKNNDLHQKLNKKIYEFFDINPERKTLSGVEIMQAHFSLYSKLLESSPNQSVDVQQVQAFLKLYKDHVYWYVEEGVYYMSTVPHILADKKNTNNPMKLSSWLNNNQGGDWDSAIMAYGKDVRDMPQSLYHFYLLMLQGLGDLTQAEVDLFELPTTKELNLPDKGRINVVLSSDAEKVSFKVGYEYSMLESVLTADGGMGTIAVLGVLAAYAIPAYRDYEVRAQIGEQLVLASPVKVAVNEFWVVNQSFVGVQEAVEASDLNFYIDEEIGMIVIDLEGVNAEFDSGDAIYLEPVFNEWSVEWVCSSNIKAAYLPSSCR